MGGIYHEAFRSFGNLHQVELGSDTYSLLLYLNRKRAPRQLGAAEWVILATEVLY